jgi:AcrR family transcriptional regulator
MAMQFDTFRTEEKNKHTPVDYYRPEVLRIVKMTPRDRRSKGNKKRIIMVALRLFSQKGFHNTTIIDIANAYGMSVGNMYNYFKSKEELAKYTTKYSASLLGDILRPINHQHISPKEKLYAFVHAFLSATKNSPEVIEYFLNVYVSNRQLFRSGTERFLYVREFVNEVMIFLEEGIGAGDFREQSFIAAFSLIMGTLGSIAFLHGENMLNRDLLEYTDDTAKNIYQALRK